MGTALLDVRALETSVALVSLPAFGSVRMEPDAPAAPEDAVVLLDQRRERVPRLRRERPDREVVRHGGSLDNRASVSQIRGSDGPKPTWRRSASDRGFGSRFNRHGCFPNVALDLFSKSLHMNRALVRTNFRLDGEYHSRAVDFLLNFVQ